MLVGPVRAHGNFDRLNHDMAVAHAAQQPRPLAAGDSDVCRLASASAVTNYRNLLFDIMVYVQDVAVPLALEVLPRDAAVVGADPLPKE